MNYVHYEKKIVESLGVALTNWPVHGLVRNPGELTRDDATVLRNALASRECKWIKLTSQQVEIRKASNKQRSANGEKVYGPPRKQRARSRKGGPGPSSSDGVGMEDVTMDEDAPELSAV